MTGPVVYGTGLGVFFGYGQITESEAIERHLAGAAGHAFDGSLWFFHEHTGVCWQAGGPPAQPPAPLWHGGLPVA